MVPLTLKLVPFDCVPRIPTAEMGAGSGSCDDNGYFASLLACRPDGDLNVLAQGREKVH